MPPTMLPIDHLLSNSVALDVCANGKAKLNSNSPPFNNSSSFTAPLEIKNPWDLSRSDGLYVTCSSTHDGTRKSSCIEYRARDDEFTDEPTTGGCYYNNVGPARGPRIFHVNCPGIPLGKIRCDNMKSNPIYPTMDHKCPSCLRDDELMDEAKKSGVTSKTGKSATGAKDKPPFSTYKNADVNNFAASRGLAFANIHATADSFLAANQSSASFFNSIDPRLLEHHQKLNHVGFSPSALSGSEMSATRSRLDDMWKPRNLNGKVDNRLGITGRPYDLNSKSQGIIFFNKKASKGLHPTINKESVGVRRRIDFDDGGFRTEKERRWVESAAASRFQDQVFKDPNEFMKADLQKQRREDSKAKFPIPSNPRRYGKAAEHLRENTIPKLHTSAYGEPFHRSDGIPTPNVLKKKSSKLSAEENHQAEQLKSWANRLAGLEFPVREPTKLLSAATSSVHKRSPNTADQAKIKNQADKNGIVSFVEFNGERGVNNLETEYIEDRLNIPKKDFPKNVLLAPPQAHRYTFQQAKSKNVALSVPISTSSMLRRLEAGIESSGEAELTGTSCVVHPQLANTTEQSRFKDESGKYTGDIIMPFLAPPNGSKAGAQFQFVKKSDRPAHNIIPMVQQTEDEGWDMVSDFDDDETSWVDVPSS